MKSANPLPRCACCSNTARYGSLYCGPCAEATSTSAHDLLLEVTRHPGGSAEWCEAVEVLLRRLVEEA